MTLTASFATGEDRRLPLPTGLLIGGQVVEGRAAPIEVTNPATGEVFTQVAGATNRTSTGRPRRHETFRGTWRTMPIHDRARLINRFADGIEARMAELYRARDDEQRAADHRDEGPDHPARRVVPLQRRAASRRPGAVVPLRGDYHAYTSRFPLGVVGILSSFNHPMMIASKSLAPALATGNTVVLKPSEQTPLTALLLGEIALDAGIPAGVLNVVPGLGPTAGAALTEHPLVKKVVFTGGTEPGRAIALATAKRFAKATLELGGKSPVLVFDDAPSRSPPGGPLSADSSGPVRPVSPAAGCSFSAHLRRFRRGPLEDRRFGPHRGSGPGRPPNSAPSSPARPGHGSSTTSRSGLDEGARLAAGGHAAHVPGLPGGFFVEPTVLADVTNDMRIAREEIFGPVVVAIPFEDEDEAVSLANDSPFGLGLGDLDAGRRAGTPGRRRLETGMVWVNDHHRLDPSSPWGGVGESGIGREGGWESFNDFTNVRAVTIRTAPDDVDWYGGVATEGSTEWASSIVLVTCPRRARGRHDPGRRTTC